MPVAHSRRIRNALWFATAALLVPFALTIGDLLDAGAGDVRSWARIVALGIVAGALGLLLARQRSFERRMAEQERMESALRQSEARFFGILSIAADAIITVDQQRHIVHFNRGAEEIFGYTAADVIGGSLDVLLPPRYRPAHEHHMNLFARAPEQARRMGERREIFGLRADGTEFPAEASISKLATPGGEGMLFTVVLRDITERKMAEQNERFMAEASTTLAHSLDVDAVARTAADLAVPHLGDVAWLDLVGPGDDLRRIAGTRHHESLSGAVDDLARAPLTLDSPSPVVDVIRRGRYELVTAVDDEWLEANEEPAAIPAWRALGARAMLIVPVTAADRTFGALTLIMVTPRRTFSADDAVLAGKFAASVGTALDNARLYAAAQRANRARDEVLNVVSHDLRNPLSAIAMCARTLDDNPSADDARRHELIGTIRESAAWAHRLIQDLVDVASIEQGRLSLEPQNTDPSQLVLQAWHMFEVEAMEHGITLDQSLPANLPFVVADSGRIVQVLGNLVRNAIKFTPNGGRITLGAEARDSDVVFFVRDTGAGIPAPNQARIFDRFWQSSAGARGRGTGLGLSIAKGIVEAHGGQIRVESAPHHGSTFFFSLPRSSTR